MFLLRVDATIQGDRSASSALANGLTQDSAMAKALQSVALGLLEEHVGSLRR